MELRLKILRFNPQKDKKPHWENYLVNLEPTDRIIDALHYVKQRIDGSLAFRKSCQHGICGSDAMRINGKNSLACKVLVKDVRQPVKIQPLPSLKVEKDLIVDMEGFFENYKKVQPYLINNSPPPQKERLQSPSQREIFDDTTKCILCGCCTTSCPSFWFNKNYLGPQAIVTGHRFIFDSRDEAKNQRLKILSSKDGVWRCRTIFSCTVACPREIKITKAIQEIKKEILIQND